VCGCLCVCVCVYVRVCMCVCVFFLCVYVWVCVYVRVVRVSSMNASVCVVCGRGVGMSGALRDTSPTTCVWERVCVSVCVCVCVWVWMLSHKLQSFLQIKVPAPTFWYTLTYTHIGATSKWPFVWIRSPFEDKLLLLLHLTSKSCSIISPLHTNAQLNYCLSWRVRICLKMDFCVCRTSCLRVCTCPLPPYPLPPPFASLTFTLLVYMFRVWGSGLGFTFLFTFTYMYAYAHVYSKIRNVDQTWIWRVFPGWWPLRPKSLRHFVVLSKSCPTLFPWVLTCVQKYLSKNMIIEKIDRHLHDMHHVSMTETSNPAGIE